MRLKFKKQVGNDTFQLYTRFEVGEEKIIIGIIATDYSVLAIYREGYFEILGTMLLGEKSFTRIKCPKDLKWEVEDHLLITKS